MLRMLALGGAASMVGCSSLHAVPAAQADESPKNIIVFIADGGGYSAHLATAMWEGGPPAWQNRDWHEVSVATYALRHGQRAPRGADLLAQDPTQVFDPAKAWSDAPLEGAAGGYPFCFAGYRWLRATAPDSANTASAIFTGVSSYTGAINVDGAMQPVRSAAEAAKAAGKAVGVVSSVPFSHATPACAGGAHNPTREDYHGIAAEMLRSGHCDFIAGAGHPGFDNDGQPRQMKYEWISEETFSALRAGTWRDAAGRAWTLVDNTGAITALGEAPSSGPVLALAPVADTLQMERRAKGDAKASAPGDDPLSPGLPTLVDLALAGLNAVDDDPEGFLLTVEGGAVDWAMHANQCGRMIEEMQEFHRTVEAVLARLDAGSASPDPTDPSWENTLVLITADHDHLLVGPDGERVAFQALEDQGPGKVPGHRWMSNGHSNRPVPLWVRGPGRAWFESIATLDDQTSVGGVRVGRGAYFHQAEIGKALMGMLRAR